MCMKTCNAEKIFFDKLTGLLTYPFSSDCTYQLLLELSWNLSVFCRYFTDKLKMYMKKFDAEKIDFNKLTGLLT